MRSKFGCFLALNTTRFRDAAAWQAKPTKKVDFIPGGFVHTAALLLDEACDDEALSPWPNQAHALHEFLHVQAICYVI